MTQIQPPAWARRREVWLYSMRLSDYETIQRLREQMLRVVHIEVESYLNTPGLYFETDDAFPNRKRLTGEYYVGAETYNMHTGPVWFQVSVVCRCLELPREGRHEDLDYLGLEVWLRYDPGTTDFEVFRNTDTSVI